MSNDLRLQVILDLANKASGPLRNIEKSSAAAAKVLKETRDTLQKLNQQQRAVDGFNKQRAALRESTNKVRVLRQDLEVLNATQGTSKKEIAAAEKALAKATASYDKHRDAVFKLRHQLTNLGITKVSDAEKRLKADIAATTKAFDEQTAKIKALNDQRGKLYALNRKHSKEMIEVGMMAGTGVGMQAAGRSMAAPVLSSVQTYAQQESSTSQLKGSMMLANGQVSAEFKQINDLAMRLGDKLPGTTADFIDMMTMLRRQGLSAQSILGGTGEAAAYLGVQLKLPSAQAAEFAAKMQDATRSSEKDMMGLMDLIQRTYYSGVDSGNMLEAFKGLGPTMDTIKRHGLDGAKALAPFVVMMDQMGMQGGAAGNAVNKVVSRSLNVDQISKVVRGLKKDKGIDLNLDFTNGKGEFGGIDQMMQQLSKLKQFDTVTRLSILKDIYGDDKETNDVLSKIIGQGMTGYNDVIAKLQAQADLRQRVDAELGTIANLWDAATGSFTNVMAAAGQTIAPEVKAISTWLNEAAGSMRAWIEEHPTLVGWIVKITAVVAGLVFAFGTLALTLASIMGPFLITRFLLSRTALSLFGMRNAATTTAPAVSRLAGVMGKLSGWGSAIGKGLGNAAIKAWGHAVHWAGQGLSKLGTIISKVPGWFVSIGKGMATAARFLMANPMVLIITAIVLAIAGLAYLIYKNWAPIKAFFNDLWEGIKTATGAAWEWIKSVIISSIAWILSSVAAIKNKLGNLWESFKEFGGMLMDGLVGGITSRLAAVKNAITSVADSTVGWFKEKLGIRSPSRVFMQQGHFLGEGAAIGLQRSTSLVRKASVGMAAAAAIGMATAGPRIDSRPPLTTGQRAPAVAQGDTITIQIHAAPGMDPQALARAVSAELDKRDRLKAARRRSTLGDVS